MLAVHTALTADWGCAPDRPRPVPPSALYPFFHDLQHRRVFPDQKTFVDARPNKPPRDIAAAYLEQSLVVGFQLDKFTRDHFVLPELKCSAISYNRTQDVKQHIALKLAELRREPDKIDEDSSLLPLEHAYVVPGDRFREIYYWDSYFTILGLDHDRDLAHGMVANFASMIKKFGHVPNGNRSYYLSRSQPPMFASMLQHLAITAGNDAIITKHLPELQKELEYWMAGAAHLGPGQHHAHAVRLQDGTLLNRYWDELDTPRDESYAQDIETATRAVGRQPGEVYRDLRAGGESGCDFGSRLLEPGGDLSTIRTTRLLAIDQNCMLWNLESVLAHAERNGGNYIAASQHQHAADTRAEAIRRVMWDEKLGVFTDHLFAENRSSGQITAFTVTPLFFGIANQAQADRVAETIRDKLLAPGGLGTSLVKSGEQWDKPNGWAPLQYMAVIGLRQYGHGDLAREIATRWINKNLSVFKRTGALYEKYDVDGPIDEVGQGGGEYDMQSGFGWTIGVLDSFMRMYPDEAAAAQRAHAPAEAIMDAAFMQIADELRPATSLGDLGDLTAALTAMPITNEARSAITQAVATLA